METIRPWWVLVGGRRRLGRYLAEGLAASCNLVLTSGQPWGGDEPWIKELSDITEVRTLMWNAEDPGLVPSIMADSEALMAEGIRPTSVVVLAGAFPQQSLGTWDPQNLEALWRLNLSFPLLVAQGLAPWMTDGGCLQFLLDTCIHRPFSKRIPYSASKSALAAAVPGLAMVLAPRLRVVGHALGTLLPDAESDPRLLAERCLLQRVGAPADLLGAVQYASQASFLTGEILTLDGGFRWR